MPYPASPSKAERCYYFTSRGKQNPMEHYAQRLMLMQMCIWFEKIEGRRLRVHGRNGLLKIQMLVENGETLDLGDDAKSCRALMVFQGRLVEQLFQ